MDLVLLIRKCAEFIVLGDTITKTVIGARMSVLLDEDDMDEVIR